MTNVIHAAWCGRYNGQPHCTCGSHDIVLARKRRERFATIDSLPPELRVLVHHYGWTVVRAYLDAGISKPANIRHLVETVLDEFSPTRGSRSRQGPQPEIARAMTEAHEEKLMEKSP